MLRTIAATLILAALLLAAAPVRAAHQVTPVRGPTSLSALMLAQAQSQTGTYKPPLRGAPNPRASAASRDASPVDSRVALVIGNAAYKHQRPLKNPVNDATAMADTLRHLGFDVVFVTDADRNAMVRALGEFRKNLHTDGVGLFYYAGHGLQVRGKNWLLPVDADIGSESDAPLLGFDQEAVQNGLEDAGVRLSILVFDACRDNPFERRFRSAGSRGLAAVDAARGTLLAYATSPGKTADDGDSGRGLYTAELLKTMIIPGLSLEEVFKQTAAAVEKASGNRQTPWYNSAFHGTFYFSGPITVNVAPPPATEPELLFWQTIATGSNAADFEDYLRQFPEGHFAGLARTRLAVLQASEIQRALRALGLYRGNTEAGVGPATAAAIKQFQSLASEQQTGSLSAPERDTLLDMARRLSTLLETPPASPQGVAAASIKSSEQRYVRGWNFESGKGVKADPVEAAYWYALAAADGDARALSNLGTLVVRGWGGNKPDPSAAAALWWAAAARGEAIAMFNLGASYENGIGVTADLARARSWYERAAARNHAGAREALKRLGA